MIKMGSTLAIVAGSVGALALAYLATAAARGAHLREMPPMSWISPPPAKEHAAEPAASAPAAAATPVPVPPAPVQKPMTAGVLSAFVMPSPFAADELRELQKMLKEKLASLAAESDAQARRARELDDWQHALEARALEIAALRESIAAPAGAAPQGATAAQTQTSAADAPQSWRALAPLFEEGDPADLAARLADFPPEDAANILRGLEPERAAAILNALPKDKYKPFLDAWRRADG